MGRSSRRHAVHPSGWSRTAREAASPALVQRTTAPALVTPDASGSQTDALVIEANVLARLLGVKLLTLQGTVLVSPAQVRALAAESTRQGRAHHELAELPESRAPSNSAGTQLLGPGLAEAGRIIAANDSTISAIAAPDSGGPGA